MLEDIVDVLVCPHCRCDLDVADTAVLCDQGHSFDIARQGYVSLLTGAASGLISDSSEMIAARELFLDSGHFDPLMNAVADAAVSVVVPGPDQVILELGAGTGHYLARAVDSVPQSRGVGIDLSKPAARRMARVHPRVGAVVADVWRTFPVRDHAVAVALSVFAPRHPAELERVLTSDGGLVILTPTPAHLQELIAPLGMVSVDERKPERLGQSLSGRFERVRRTPIDYRMRLGHSLVESLVGMGPSAHHLGPAERTGRIGRLPDPIEVTASVVISAYRPVQPAG